jgi:hypothetical protein
MVADLTHPQLLRNHIRIPQNRDGVVVMYQVVR